MISVELKRQVNPLTAQRHAFVPRPNSGKPLRQIVIVGERPEKESIGSGSEDGIPFRCEALPRIVKRLRKLHIQTTGRTLDYERYPHVIGIGAPRQLENYPVAVQLAADPLREILE